VRGSPTPRIWTPPLRELSRETSFGYDLIDFAEAIGWPLDPWQAWLGIHMGELLPDGRPRFRMVLAIVSRQNGKTLFSRILTLYWLYVEQVPLVLGVSASRETAKESWRRVIAMAGGIEWLAEVPHAERYTLGEECFTVDGSEYRFSAPNRRAGRSFTVHRGIMDELREMKAWDAYGALVNAMNAVPDAQVVAITNQGEASAVVLDSLRDSAIKFIETGQGDPRLFLAEWSAPNGADPTDPEALAMANPDLGNRVLLDSLIGQAMTSKAQGGAKLAQFRTENMCQRVTLLDSAIDEDAWRSAGTDEPVDLTQHRDKLALCVDVALDGSHATLMAAAQIDGITHVEVVQMWEGYDSTTKLRQDLPRSVEKFRPRALGWFPNGPAAAVTAALSAKAGGRSWAKGRTRVAELTTETAAVCMGLAEQVSAGEVQHTKDPMLDAHVKATQKLRRGDAWVFTRRGKEPIDATYALAGAVHLARTMPAPLPPLQVA
jgi:phage terminase large subunit-like protein